MSRIDPDRLQGFQGHSGSDLSSRRVPILTITITSTVTLSLTLTEVDWIRCHPPGGEGFAPLLRRKAGVHDVVRFWGCNGGPNFATLIDLHIGRGANLQKRGEAFSSGGSVVRFRGCNGGSTFLTLNDLSIGAGANLEKSASGGFRSHLDLSKIHEMSPEARI